MAFPVIRAPQMKLWKEGIAAAESLPVGKTQKDGINCGSYDKLLVNVVPSGGANPTISMLVWSDQADDFIQIIPAADFAAPGADTPYSFEFEAAGRIVYPAVTVLASGQCAIEISAHDVDPNFG